MRVLDCSMPCATKSAKPWRRRSTLLCGCLCCISSIAFTPSRLDAFRVDVDGLATHARRHGAQGTQLVRMATELQEAMFRASCAGTAADADRFAQLHFELADAAQSFCAEDSGDGGGNGGDGGGSNAGACDGAARAVLSASSLHHFGASALLCLASPRGTRRHEPLAALGRALHEHMTQQVQQGLAIPASHDTHAHADDEAGRNQSRSLAAGAGVADGEHAGGGGIATARRAVWAHREALRLLPSLPRACPQQP